MLGLKGLIGPKYTGGQEFEIALQKARNFQMSKG